MPWVTRIIVSIVLLVSSSVLSERFKSDVAPRYCALLSNTKSTSSAGNDESLILGATLVSTDVQAQHYLIFVRLTNRQFLARHVKLSRHHDTPVDVAEAFPVHDIVDNVAYYRRSSAIFNKFRQSINLIAKGNRAGQDVVHLFDFQMDNTTDRRITLLEKDYGFLNDSYQNNVLLLPWLRPGNEIAILSSVNGSERYHIRGMDRILENRALLLVNDTFYRLHQSIENIKIFEIEGKYSSAQFIHDFAAYRLESPTYLIAFNKYLVFLLRYQKDDEILPVLSKHYWGVHLWIGCPPENCIAPRPDAVALHDNQIIWFSGSYFWRDFNNIHESEVAEKLPAGMFPLSAFTDYSTRNIHLVVTDSAAFEEHAQTRILSFSRDFKEYNSSYFLAAFRKFNQKLVARAILAVPSQDERQTDKVLIFASDGAVYIFHNSFPLGYNLVFKKYEARKIILHFKNLPLSIDAVFGYRKNLSSPIIPIIVSGPYYYYAESMESFWKNGTTSEGTHLLEETKDIFPGIKRCRDDVKSFYGHFKEQFKVTTYEEFIDYMTSNFKAESSEASCASMTEPMPYFCTEPGDDDEFDEMDPPGDGGGDDNTPENDSGTLTIIIIALAILGMLALLTIAGKLIAGKKSRKQGEGLSVIVDENIGSTTLPSLIGIDKSSVSRSRRSKSGSRSHTSSGLSMTKSIRHQPIEKSQGFSVQGASALGFGSTSRADQSSQR